MKGLILAFFITLYIILHMPLQPELQEIFNRLNSKETCYLASIDQGEPRVRIMALIPYGEQYWAVTHHDRKKYQQFLQNSHFEFCTTYHDQSPTGSIRCRGVVEMITDLGVKKELAGAISWFPSFFRSYEDPDFVLYKLHIHTIIARDPVSKHDAQFTLA